MICFVRRRRVLSLRLCVSLSFPTAHRLYICLTLDFSLFYCLISLSVGLYVTHCHSVVLYLFPEKHIGRLPVVRFSASQKSLKATTLGDHVKKKHRLCAYERVCMNVCLCAYCTHPRVCLHMRCSAPFSQHWACSRPAAVLSGCV